MQEVVIAAIFTSKGLLVGQRLSAPFQGYWECPGGKVENGEPLIEALIREIEEEGSAQIETAHAMFDYDVLTPSGPMHLTWFIATLKNDFKVVIYDKIQYIKKEEVDALSWIPHNRPYLEKLKAFFPHQT